MKTLKQRVRTYLEDQRPYYEEVDENLEILETQSEDLSGIGSTNKMLILRLIDDDELYLAIEKQN